MLSIGTQAPDFTLPDQNGELHSLSDFKGQKVILYFYPRDNTAGCTKQACAFGELYPQFREKGAVVLGVSKDSVASHKRFEEKFGLPFTLLSDTEKEVIQAYDVWKEKSSMARSAWALCAPPTSSAKTASLSKPLTKSRLPTILRRCSACWNKARSLWLVPRTDSADAG